MSLSQSMGISISSMRNNQIALGVVSHNIANLNTEGYTRQRVNFSETRLSINADNVIAKIHSLAGSDIDSISGFVDNAAYRNLVDAEGNASYYGNLADALGELEDVADALGDNGLNALLNDFYTAASNLEQFPADISIRQQYVLALDNVCDKFNYITDKYNTIQDDHCLEVTDSIDAINSLLSDLATANLAHVKNGNSPATQNQINAILSELSNYTGITYDQNQNGSFNAYIAGVGVVMGAEQIYKLESKYDIESNPPLSITMNSLKDGTKTKDISGDIASGSLKTNIDFLNGTNATVGFATIGEIKAAVKEAQDAFKNALNAIQQYANDDGDNKYAAYLKAQDGELVLASDGTKPSKPVELLVYDEKGNLQVNSEVMSNPYLIAAARIDLDDYQPGEDWTKAIGNSDNAGLMVELQNAKICSYGGGVNNCTLSQFLINSAAKTGMDLASAESKAELYQGIADAAKEDYANMTGVNLDEELADMIKYQRAFEASAKVFSAADYILQTIISIV